MLISRDGIDRPLQITHAMTVLRFVFRFLVRNIIWSHLLTDVQYAVN